MSAVFDRIYQHNSWNGVESRSGPGSGAAATRRVAEDVVRLVEAFDFKSVLDLGCGDGWWMPELPGYVGYDASSVAIRLARANHPDRTYVDVLPEDEFDLVICRDVMQHLPLNDGLRLLAKAVGRGRWLLASTYVGGENVDIEAGEAFSPDLEQPPFAIGKPVVRIFDGYHYHEHDTNSVRDPRKYLALWQR